MNPATSPFVTFHYRNRAKKLIATRAYRGSGCACPQAKSEKPAAPSESNDIGDTKANEGYADWQINRGIVEMASKMDLASC